MVTRASSANPAVLRWARERAGLSLEDAARAISRPAEVVREWEKGQASPTFRQLADLAHRVYKRPVAIFFFPGPPDETPITSQFRTLPQSDVEALEPDTLFALRDARALQLAVPELLANIDGLFQRSVAELRALPGESAEALAARLRSVFGVTPDTQRSWRDTETALKEWRKAVELFGVFVFKRSFEQGSVSGFCLDDQQYPLIMLNNGTAHARQIFTLFHELAHISFRVSGVTTRSPLNLGSLTRADRDIEIACNRFAADFLLPWSAIDWSVVRSDDPLPSIEELARSFHVSREVVLRRLCDAGLIPAARYDTYVAEWRDDYSRANGGKGGGSYYANQGTYLSDLYVRAALHQYHAGRLEIGDLADRLRIKAQNVGRFEEFVLRRGGVD